MKEILITSSVLIAALLLLRLIFAQTVRRTLIYGAWALAALRLLIPVQIGELRFSVLTAAQPVIEAVDERVEDAVLGTTPQAAYRDQIEQYIEKDQTVFVPEVREQIKQELAQGNQSPEEIYDKIQQQFPEQEILTETGQELVNGAAGFKVSDTLHAFTWTMLMIWNAGIAVMAVWFAIVNLRHGQMLRRNREKLDCDSPIPVYVSGKVGSPCLVGLFCPAVYLTPESAEDPDRMRHVLTHELTHFAHRDHIWSLVRCVCLCVYWFNPLVWVAAWFSRRDCELACDEGALKRLGEGERIAYGKSLLDVVSHASAPAHLIQTATAMNETKKQLKERVNFIVKKPKISIIAAVCMVLICAIVVGCAAAGPNVRYTITVQKKDMMLKDADAETMVLSYDGSGYQLERQFGAYTVRRTYDEKGNVLSYKKYISASEELTEETDYFYNRAGQLIRAEGFGCGDWDVRVDYLREYSYDDAGNMTHEQTYQDGELFEEYYYDAIGNLTEEFRYYGGGYDIHTVYTYTEDGKLLSNYTERGGELYSGWDYFYDESGRIVREERFTISDGVRKELTNTYTYDENGRCVRYDMGGFQGECSYEIYSYDAAGNMLSSMYTDREGETTGYRWTYDAQGRMLSMESVSKGYNFKHTWTYDAQGNVETMSGQGNRYTFSYSLAEVTMPQKMQEEIRRYFAGFTGLSVYTPDNYSRL